MKKDIIKDVIIMIAIAVILSLIIALVDRDKPYVAEPSLIPVPPDTSGKWYFDFTKEEWRPVYRVDPRANGEFKPREPQGITEDDLQDYLEDHVDDYLEDTYWGEEYDLNDKDDE